MEASTLRLAFSVLLDALSRCFLVTNRRKVMERETSLEAGAERDSQENLARIMASFPLREAFGSSGAPQQSQISRMLNDLDYFETRRKEWMQHFHQWLTGLACTSASLQGVYCAMLEEAGLLSAPLSIVDQKRYNQAQQRHFPEAGARNGLQALEELANSANERLYLLHLLFTSFSDFLPTLKRAVSRGCPDIRLLMVQPFSSAAHIRYIGHKAYPEDADAHVLHNIRLIFTDPELKGRVKVRLYTSLPTVNLMIADDRALSRIFLNGNQIDESLFISAPKSQEKEWFQQMESHFFATWDTALEINEAEANYILKYQRAIGPMFHTHLEVEKSLLKTIFSHARKEMPLTPLLASPEIQTESPPLYFKCFYWDKGIKTFVLEYYPGSGSARLTHTPSRRVFIGYVQKNPNYQRIQTLHLHALDPSYSRTSPTTFLLHTSDMTLERIISGCYLQVNLDSEIASGIVVLQRLEAQEQQMDPDLQALAPEPVPDMIQLFLENQHLLTPDKIVEDDKGFREYAKKRMPWLKHTADARRTYPGSYLLFGRSSRADSKESVIITPVQIEPDGEVTFDGESFRGWLLAPDRRRIVIPFSRSSHPPLSIPEGLLALRPQGDDTHVLVGRFASINPWRHIDGGRVAVVPRACFEADLPQIWETASKQRLDSPELTALLQTCKEVAILRLLDGH